MNIPAIREITIVAGDFQITSPECYCNSFEIRKEIGYRSMYELCDNPLSIDTSDLTISLKCFGLHTSMFDGKLSPIKIRNKLVKDCTIEELFTAIRAKSKETKI